MTAPARWLPVFALLALGTVLARETVVAQQGTWAFQRREVHARPFDLSTGPNETLNVSPHPNPPGLRCDENVRVSVGDTSANSSARSFFTNWNEPDDWASRSSRHNWSAPPTTLTVGDRVRIAVTASLAVSATSETSGPKMTAYFADTHWEATTEVQLYQGGMLLLRDSSGTVIDGQGAAAGAYYGNLRRDSTGRIDAPGYADCGYTQLSQYASPSQSEGSLKIPAGERDGEELIVVVNLWMAGSSRAVFYRYLYSGAPVAERPAVAARTPAEPVVPPADVPWELVVGGGGLAAAALGLVALYLKRRGNAGDTSDAPPEGPVGYVLQISQDRITLQPGVSVPFTATVWAVNATGATSLASSATITIGAPTGVVVTPLSGAGRLVARIAAAKDCVAGPRTLTVSAHAGGSAYQASAAITIGQGDAYTLTLTQTAINLSRDGRETVSARVNVSGPDANRCEAESQRLSAAVTFALSGNCRAWLSASDRVEGGSTVGTLDLTIPDGASKLPGPHTATYTATVNTPSGLLSQACVITIGTSNGFELAMDRVLRLKANDVAGSLLCCLTCSDDSVPDAAALIRAATASIRVEVSGHNAPWIREEGGAYGALFGRPTGGDTPGVQLRPLAETPMAELASAPPYSALITASATIPGHGSVSAVTAVEIVAPEWFVEAKILKKAFVLDGKDSAEFQARLIPQQQYKLELYGGENGNQLNPLLQFTPIGDNAANAVLTETNGADGYRTMAVSFSAEAKDCPTDSIDIEITAQLTGESVRQVLRINLLGKPAIRVSAADVSFRVGGDPLKITAEVENPGAETWEITATLKELAAVTMDGPDPAGANTVTLTLTPASLPDDEARAQGTLEFTARSKTQDLEPVTVSVTVQDEGLLVLTDPAIVFPDPKVAKPGLIKLQVLRWKAEQKRFVLDRAAMQNGVTFGAFTSGDYLNGEKVFKGAGVHAAFQWLNGSGLEEYAVYKVLPNVFVPGDATPIDARWDLTTASDGGNPEKFTKTLKVQFPADPSLAVDAKLAKEIANCRKIIALLPTGKRDSWEQKILGKDAALLGTKGLYKMRHEIWDEARTCLVQESQDYLEDAEYLDHVVTLLEWAQWINDLAWQAVSSAAVPFPGSLAVDQLRSFLTEYCAAACNEGTSLEVFAKSYFQRLYDGGLETGADLAVGLVVDLDHLGETLLKRFPGEPIKAVIAACEIVWVTGFIQFLSYKKNPATGNPHSIPEAAWEATKMLRDQVIVSVLCRDWKARHGEPGAAAPESRVNEPGPKANESGLKEKVPAAGVTKTAPAVKEQAPAPPTGDGPSPRRTPEPGSVVHPDTPQQSEPHLNRFREAPPTLTERENGWRDGKQEGQTIIDQAHKAAASKDPAKVRDAALAMQANKHGLYELNRQTGTTPAETRQTLKNDIQKIYDKTDGKVCNELKQQLRTADSNGNVHEPEVRVKSISNEPKPGAAPKDPSKMSIDRDATFERTAAPGELIPDPETPGMFTEAKGGEWVDVPAKKSASVYNKNFKETALEGASPEARAKYANMTPEQFGKHMDQTVTDRIANDAYGRGPRDLDTAVRNPGGEFSDPSGVAKTSEFKASEWYEKAERDAKTPAEHETYVAEGMRQTTKQFGNQVENRMEILNKFRGEGSANPDLPKVTPPPELKAGIDILRKVADGTSSPATADLELAKLGMTRADVSRNLADFMAKIYKMPVAP